MQFGTFILGWHCQCCAMEELAANKQATEFAARVLVFVSRGFGHRGLEDPKGFVFGLSVSGKRNALNPQYRYTKKKKRL